MRITRRSLRRPPGRASRSRPCGSGCAAGGSPRPLTASSWPSWPSSPAARTTLRAKFPPRRLSAPASCVAGPAGARAAWPTRPKSAGRTRSCIRCAPRRLLASPQPATRPAIVRYQWPCPGQLLHMDVKKFGKFTAPGHALTGIAGSAPGGWAGSTCTRSSMTARGWPTEIHDDERAETVTALTERALDWLLEHGIVAERLMTDNSFAHTQNKGLRDLLTRLVISHLRTRPYTPGTNGKVERYQQTLQREWAYAMEYASTQATPAAPRWHPECATTTSGAPTAPLATGHRSSAFGTSPGSTARARSVSFAQGVRSTKGRSLVDRATWPRVADAVWRLQTYRAPRRLARRTGGRGRGSVAAAARTAGGRGGRGFL